MSFAPCPSDHNPGMWEPHPRDLRVVVHSVRLNSDMEGDDDLVPFYDNRADVYGYVTIGTTKFELKQLTDNNNPVWDPGDGTFEADVTNNPVPIRIELYEGDPGSTAYDDAVDINPNSGKNHLDLLFDTCSLRLSGDLETSAQTVVESAGTGSSGGRIRFTVEMVDGSPDTVDDLAIVELGLVQVIHKPTRLIAGKPAVLMARVANNSNEVVETVLHVRISGPGGGVNIGEDFPLKLEPGELRKEYLHQEDPLILPAGAGSYDLFVQGTIDDPFSPRLPVNDCRRTNDALEKPYSPVRVVNTRNVNLMWAKVGGVLDITDLVPDDHFGDITVLGSAYIQATYPVAKTSTFVAPFPLVPPTTAVYEWMTTLLAFLPWQGGARSLTPFILIWELNLVASGIPGRPTIMGVLPSHDWFDQFVGWGERTGASMGPYAPHAVIFTPRTQDGYTGVRGPKVTLPAHELGHTFGLSVDSRLKDSWLCDLSWPVVGSLPCDAAGGLDEYNHSDSALTNGNPASGYWVHQPDEPASVSADLPDGRPNPMANNEVCDAGCFMGLSRPIGSSAADAAAHWRSRRRWIDRADYEHLINKLQGPDVLAPLAAGLASDQSLFVSGIIAWNDEIYIGPIALQEKVEPELTLRKGLYGIRSLDIDGRAVAEVGLPLNWNVGEYDGAFPFTTFAVTIPFHHKSHTIEFLNRGTGKRLGTQVLDRSNGSVSLSSLETDSSVDRGEVINLSWSVREGTGKPTHSVVLVSPGKDIWWPATTLLSESSHDLDTTVLEPGAYMVRIAVIDGIDVLSSGNVPFKVKAGIRKGLSRLMPSWLR